MGKQNNDILTNQKCLELFNYKRCGGFEEFNSIHVVNNIVY